MPWQKGESGNPGGRPTGASIKERVLGILEHKLVELELRAHDDTLPAVDRLAAGFLARAVSAASEAQRDVERDPVTGTTTIREDDEESLERRLKASRVLLDFFKEASDRIDGKATAYIEAQVTPVDHFVLEDRRRQALEEGDDGNS